MVSHCSIRMNIKSCARSGADATMHAKLVAPTAGAVVSPAEDEAADPVVGTGSVSPDFNSATRWFRADGYRLRCMSIS
jgi:hypothetical protein